MSLITFRMPESSLRDLPGATNNKNKTFARNNPRLPELADRLYAAINERENLLKKNQGSFLDPARRAFGWSQLIFSLINFKNLELADFLFEKAFQKGVFTMENTSCEEVNEKGEIVDATFKKICEKIVKAFEEQKMQSFQALADADEMEALKVDLKEARPWSFADELQIEEERKMAPKKERYLSV